LAPFTANEAQPAHILERRFGEWSGLTLPDEIFLMLFELSSFWGSQSVKWFCQTLRRAVGQAMSSGQLSLNAAALRIACTPNNHLAYVAFFVDILQELLFLFILLEICRLLPPSLIFFGLVKGRELQGWRFHSTLALASL
jgi:hypothetical protein